MKLTKTLGWLAMAGALVAVTPAAQATIKFSSSVTLKLTATVQDEVETSTSDGFESTTQKLSIVNKDILTAFEDWWPTTLPSGANLALDQNYNIVIVDKDGDVLFDATDLDGFLNLDYSDTLTSDGRYKEKDNGDYSYNFTETYFITLGLLQGVETRSAAIDVETDSAELTGLDTFTYKETFDASKDDYTYTSKDKATVQGTGTIEDSSAAISGSVTTKYNYKDDNAL